MQTVTYLDWTSAFKLSQSSFLLHRAVFRDTPKLAVLSKFLSHWDKYYRRGWLQSADLRNALFDNVAKLEMQQVVQFGHMRALHLAVGQLVAVEQVSLVMVRLLFPDSVVIVHVQFATNYLPGTGYAHDYVQAWQTENLARLRRFDTRLSPFLYGSRLNTAEARPFDEATEKSIRMARVSEPGKRASLEAERASRRVPLAVLYSNSQDVEIVVQTRDGNTVCSLVLNRTQYSNLRMGGLLKRLSSVRKCAAVAGIEAASMAEDVLNASVLQVLRWPERPASNTKLRVVVEF